MGLGPTLSQHWTRELLTGFSFVTGQGKPFLGGQDSGGAN